MTIPTRSQELTAEVKTPWLKTAAENEERNEHQTDHFISRLSRTQKMLEQAITFLETCSPYLADRIIYSDLLWGVTQPQSHMQFQQRTVKGFSCPVLVKTHRKSYLGSERRLHCIDIAMTCSPISPTGADHWKLRCWYVETSDVWWFDPNYRADWEGMVSSSWQPPARYNEHSQGQTLQGQTSES